MRLSEVPRETPAASKIPVLLSPAVVRETKWLRELIVMLAFGGATLGAPAGGRAEVGVTPSPGGNPAAVGPPPLGASPWEAATAPQDIRPERLPYDEGAPIPEGYHLARRTVPTRLVNGAIATGSGYVGALAIGWMENLTDVQMKRLFVPLLGPWWVLLSGGAGDCRHSSYEESLRGCKPGTTKVMLVVDAVIQAGGVAQFIWGFYGERYLQRDSVASVVVTPMTLGARAYGAALTTIF